MTTRPLVWFRSDLRVRDQTALFHACREATRGVVGVFTVCPEQWREHDWADVKVEFVLRNLKTLREGLAARNVPLRVLTFPTFAGAAGALLRLAEETGCDALYFNREYEVNEARRDAAVTAAFEASGRRVRAYTDAVVLSPGDVLTQGGGWYTVFSPYKRRWRERYAEHAGDGTSVLGLPKKQAEMASESDDVPAEVAGFDLSRGRADLWAAGEGHAAERLGKFVDGRIATYKDRRDIPSVNGTSTLSPYLALGVIGPRTCVAAAVEANGGDVNGANAGAAGWLDELIWREFYKHLLVAFPRLCMGRAFRPEMDAVAWSEDAAAFDAWCEGRTGYPIVDAGMRQLRQTGWMHNRLRMITAMFLTKDLLINWRWGERFFMRHLVDGDLAANNGGWQWSASTGTDAQPYFRIFNPTTQGEKFDPEGAFIRKFVPELAGVAGKAVHEPHGGGGLLRSIGGYPRPIVDHKAARERTLAAFSAVKG